MTHISGEIVGKTAPYYSYVNLASANILSNPVVFCRKCPHRTHWSLQKRLSGYGNREKQPPMSLKIWGSFDRHSGSPPFSPDVPDLALIHPRGPTLAGPVRLPGWVEAGARSAGPRWFSVRVEPRRADPLARSKVCQSCCCSGGQGRRIRGNQTRPESTAAVSRAYAVEEHGARASGAPDARRRRYGRTSRDLRDQLPPPGSTVTANRTDAGEAQGTRRQASLPARREA